MNKAEAIETVQGMIDVASITGSACIYRHNGGIEEMQNVLDCLKNSEPVKRGHWEHIGHVLGRDDLFCGICSECEKTTVSFETAPERCSHCGATMDEVEE